ncbi:MAG: hypothetical protein AB2563_06350 [Candidatus Thiodiazotropha endolucinida]
MGRALIDTQYYRQSLPLEWLKAPADDNRVHLLEFLRGVLYSLSASKNKHSREVHVAQIRSAFDTLGVPALSRIGLKLLALFREAEPLYGGYWLPTPFRVIEVNDQYLFIGAVPTSLGYLGNVRNEGLCRLLTPEIAAQFPRQSISNWMGIQQTDPSSVVSKFFHDHKLKAVPTITIAGLEYLDFVTVGHKARRRFVWSTNPVPVNADHQIAVCRQRQAGAYRYFSAEIRSGKIISEATIEQSIPRLMFALARQVDKPVVASVFHGSEAIEVTIPERLPIEVYRLALLLSKHIVRRGSSTFHLPPRFAPELIRRFISLGCVVETYK